MGVTIDFPYLVELERSWPLCVRMCVFTSVHRHGVFMDLVSLVNGDRRYYQGIPV